MSKIDARVTVKPSRRKMRSARKLRRVYAFTVLAWCLGLFVLWAIRSLNVMTGDAISLSDYDADPNVTHLIIFALFVVGLIIVLLIETLLFTRYLGKSLSARTNELMPTVLEPRLGPTLSRIDPSSTDFR